MCGIYLGLRDVEINSDFHKLIANRGPDSIRDLQLNIKGQNVQFISSVLHIRGQSASEQPIHDDASVLQWNGEVFSGFEISESVSDTSVVFDQICRSGVEETLSKVQGPFAFTFTDKMTGKIWFGRDILGRRSLLFRTKPTLEISSVCPDGDVEDWEEVRADTFYLYSIESRKLDLILKPRPSYFSLNRSAEVSDFTDNLVARFLEVLRESVLERCHNVFGAESIGILFSGGVDCSVITSLAASVLPANVAIDLYNVAFEGSLENSGNYMVPDRLTGIRSYQDLTRMHPERKFNFLSVNVTKKAYFESREHVISLMKPRNTVLDLCIASAIWFAASGLGLLHLSEEKLYTSKAKVVLVGMGADEQLAGYSRHRTAWLSSGLSGLIEEVEADLNRIPYRNLGRDDRCISDRGKEARFPFLDDKVVGFLSGLPMLDKVSMDQPRGYGEKRILRLAARRLGFSEEVAFLPKRAIQFGAKTAKIEGARKGDDIISSEENDENRDTNCALADMKGDCPAAHHRVKESGFMSRLSQRLSILKIRSVDSKNENELAALLSVLKIAHPSSFEDWLFGLESVYQSSGKISESSFCEVFSFGKMPGSKDIAVKIIPIRSAWSKLRVQPEPVALPKVILEVQIQMALKELAKLRRYSVPVGYTGFNHSGRIALLQGRYPERLLSKWDVWKSSNMESCENMRPDFYSDADYFLAIELEHGGADLENFDIKSVEQIKSIVLQLAFALDLAEQTVQFEHRDLHLGNVLVRDTYRADIRFDSKTKIETAGIVCSIIDFSFSRLMTAQGELLYSDLSKEDWLFEGISESCQQYEIYREMKEICNSDWAPFYPETNLLWLGHILSTLLTKLPALKRKGQLFDQLSSLEASIRDSKFRTVHEIVTNRHSIFL